jgi:tRNA threonylcarbamoyladenosine biosynthesis protein TsaB
MAIILNIDTSTELAGISLSKDGESIVSAENKDQKDHAAWLQVAIADMMKKAGYHFSDLSAVAVTDGPGSYTGLRVGLATAKGFCYALNIPLITEHSLSLMAFAVREELTDMDILFCPMIDARRMEVFTAVYDRDLVELVSPSAMVLEWNSFEEVLQSRKLCFFGNGSHKWRGICKSLNASFVEMPFIANYLGQLAEKKLKLGLHADLSSTDPYYIKEFYIYIKNL